MSLNHFRISVAAVMLAVSGFALASTTAPAAADDVGTDAAIGAAVGALVGTLLLDPYRGRYYYVRNYHRVYVSPYYAERWHAWHRHYAYSGVRYYGNGYWHGDRPWHGDHPWHDGQWHDHGWQGR